MAVVKEMITILSQLKNANKHVKVLANSRVIYSASYLLVYQLDKFSINCCFSQARKWSIL